MSDVKETPKKRVVGDGTPGPGRPKGVPNKATASVKAALEEAFEKRGGVAALVKWANEEPAEFYKIWGKMLPAKIEGAADGGAILIRVVRE